MPLTLLLVVVLVALVAGSAGYVLGRSSVDVGATTSEPAELAERDAFIEQLRELSWQHRDVSPELSTIIIDEISRRHRRGLPGGSDS